MTPLACHTRGYVVYLDNSRWGNSCTLFIAPHDTPFCQYADDISWQYNDYRGLDCYDISMLKLVLSNDYIKTLHLIEIRSRIRNSFLTSKVFVSELLNSLCTWPDIYHCFHQPCQLRRHWSILYIFGLPHTLIDTWTSIQQSSFQYCRQENLRGISNLHEI